eukprot:7212631-Pyramimonas_sp.AAC.1
MAGLFATLFGGAAAASHAAPAAGGRSSTRLGVAMTKASMRDAWVLTAQAGLTETQYPTLTPECISGDTMA